MKKIEGGITVPSGFQSAGSVCGLKKSGNKDLALIFSEIPAVGAGVFTKNKVKAAPVLISQKKVDSGKSQAIIINSGNANACTGQQGMENAQKMVELTGKVLNISSQKVLIASTGVIGEQLPMEKIEKGIKQLPDKLENDDLKAAEAILTTDDNIKRFAYSFKLPLRNKEIKIGGIAKGSGMIHPNMATMLGFITTDISIEKDLLQEALKEAVDVSFNRISVDGDQSTNDTVFIMANGKKLENKITKKDDDYHVFLKALKKISIDLAKSIVKDGEGATKFVTIKVKKAENPENAEKIARKVANSPLVKTACFGEDPNWGRILAAIGTAGVNIDVEDLCVKINDEKLFENGAGLDRSQLQGLMKKYNINIEILLNNGDTEVEFWSTDLSYDYIKINAEYHT